MSILNPEGILGMVGVGQIATSLLLEVHRSGLPMVLVDHEDPLIPSDTVFANNLDGMARLTNHLIGLGHRQLHFVGSSAFSRSFRDRWLGFRSALEENGLTPQAADDPMLEAGRRGDRGVPWRCGRLASSAGKNAFPADGAGVRERRDRRERVLGPGRAGVIGPRGYRRDRVRQHR